MPKLAYRLAVRTAYGSLYRSFSEPKAAMFMAEQARKMGDTATVTVYDASKPEKLEEKPKKTKKT